MVGASLAGAQAAQSLRRQGYEARLTLIGAEAHLPYERPPLSKQLLSGKWERSRIDLPLDEGLDLDLRLATRVTRVDLGTRQLSLEPAARKSGAAPERRVLGFDGLVICTGTEARSLPLLEGVHLEGVHLLRTVDDCLAIKAELAASPKVAVVGAGFIGCEVAATCRTLGLDVTIIEALPSPMARALGERMGQVLGRLHLDHGTQLRMGTGVIGLAGDRRVAGVRLDTGEVVEADLVVIGVGVAPATGWLEGSGIKLDDGVVCDATCASLRASDGAPVGNVVAAGDVARWHHPLFERSMRLEHWDNAARQADAAASTLLAGPKAGRPYAEVPWFWSNQYDTKLQFVGTAQPGDQVEVVEGSTEGRRFVAAYGREGRTVGALVLNRSTVAGSYRRLIAERAAFPPRTE